MPRATLQKEFFLIFFRLLYLVPNAYVIFVIGQKIGFKNHLFKIILSKIIWYQVQMTKDILFVPVRKS